MADRSFRILLLEDNDWDAKVVQEALQANDETRGFQVVRAQSLVQAQAALSAGPFDVVLSDLNVGDSRGVDTVRRLIHHVHGRTPIVVLTGSVSDLLGVAAVKEGAVDFVGKDHVDGRRLALSVRFAVERNANSRLAARLDQQVAETALRKSLTYTLAHELNTPFTPLVIQLHIMKSGQLGELTEAQTRCVSILDRNITRLQGLVSSLLDMGRLDNGTLKLRWGPCDLVQLAADVVETYRPMAESAGVTLALEGPKTVPITADSGRLTQVAFNLLSNALKYTPKGGRIVVSCGTEAGSATFKVEDTGPGLGPEQMSKLFKPFSQVHAEGVQKAGLGLGLFVSKGLVEAHGGTLVCESQGMGQGSTFGFKIPHEAPPVLESRPILATA